MKIFKGFCPIIFFLLISFLFFLKPTPSYADAPLISHSPAPIYSNSSKSITYTIFFPNSSNEVFRKDTDYAFVVWGPNINTDPTNNSGLHVYTTAGIFAPLKRVDDKTLQVTFSLELVGANANIGNWNYKFLIYDPNKDTITNMKNGTILSGSFAINPPGDPIKGIPGWITFDKVIAHAQTQFIAVNINPDSVYTIYLDGEHNVIHIGKLKDYPGATIETDYKLNNAEYTVAKLPITIDTPGLNKVICLRLGQPWLLFGFDCDYPSLSFDVVSFFDTGFTPTLQSSGGLIGVPDPNATIYTTDLPNVALPCGGPLVNGTCPFVKTALGNIYTTPAKFVQFIFGVVLGLAGGIALILIIISGYRYMISQGNPEAVKAATEQLTSAIIGLVFIILSFVILQVIGVDILKIPGFTK